jgi:hypothetical protein
MKGSNVKQKRGNRRTPQVVERRGDARAEELNPDGDDQPDRDHMVEADVHRVGQ